MGGDGANVDAVDGDSACGGVIEAWYKVGEGGLTGTGLSDECDGLAFGDLQTDVGQHFAVGVVTEMYMVEGDTLVEGGRCKVYRIFGLDDVGLGVEYGIDTLEGGQTTTDTVGRFAEVLGGVDDGVEDDEVIDERRGIDGGVVT